MAEGDIIGPEWTRTRVMLSTDRKCVLEFFTDGKGMSRIWPTPVEDWTECSIDTFLDLSVCIDYDEQFD
jgi:hypothetical protein